MFWFRLKKLSQIITDRFLTLALIKGAVAGTEHRMALESLKPDFVVDVGANRGQFALIARKACPSAKVISFEPLEEPAQTFRKVFSNDSNIVLHLCAIGREKTIALIHVSEDDDSSSLLPVTKMQTDLFPGSIEQTTRQVMVYPLSEVIDPDCIPPDSLLKIDVQGYELDVLQGCEGVLQRFSHLYIECSFVELYEDQALAHQIIAWLTERGFVLRSIHNIHYGKNGMAIQGDFLFSKKKTGQDG